MYTALVFDCDGVLLNSNGLKSRAFYKAALPYGETAACALVDYHVARGGISRFRKFEFLLADIVVPGAQGPGLEELLDVYAATVCRGLAQCEASSCLGALRERTAGMPWFIVSGGAQDELRDVFLERSLSELFDGGIYGSPCSKDELLSQLITGGQLQAPALFLGDSRYDHEAAKRAGLDFVFVSGWSEFKEWPEYCEEYDLPVVGSLCDL